jgi:hypothetical protein
MRRRYACLNAPPAAKASAVCGCAARVAPERGVGAMDHFNQYPVVR